MDSLNTFICRQNITRYRAMLEKESDPATRLRLTRMIDEEQAKLANVGGSDDQSREMRN
jgi:hypothetical protein